MATVSVRYIVDDVDAAIAFYTQALGFTLTMHPAPSFAMLARGDLRLLVNGTTGPGGASQPMPDGRRPEPGGWNRIQRRSTISKTRSHACADQARSFATRSSPEWAASRSSSKTPPATRSNCSSRPRSS